jgi:EAL domain-containing protein (putative c-di-GMP-specific phosphodiesterase class I)
VLELRPDFIKVDRSLIHGISEDHARRVAVSAFLSLALDLGSSVVAEGVERPQDLATVRELGLHAVQGYLLGRPTTSRDALAEWIGPDSQAGAPPARARHTARRSTRRRAAARVS